MTVYLTDGWEIFDTAKMSRSELEEANRRAARERAGNIYWSTVRPKNTETPTRS